MKIAEAPQAFSDYIDLRRSFITSKIIPFSDMRHIFAAVDLVRLR
ncbi:MAG: hypothetical protein U0521_13765 [Anaerolineae bacterium]